MDEANLRRLLLIIGAVFLVGSVITAALVMPLLQQSASPAFTSILCPSVNGTYAYAAPTSIDFCRAHDRTMGKAESTWCTFYPDSKSEACRKLVDVLLDRWADCFAFRLSKETDYPQGAPQVTEYCRQLKAN